MSPPVIHYSAASLPSLDLQFSIQNTGAGAFEIPKSQCQCPGTCNRPGTTCVGSDAVVTGIWSEQALDGSGNPITNGITPFNGVIGRRGDVYCYGVLQAGPADDQAWLGPGCTETVSVKGLVVHDVNLEQVSSAKLQICADTYGTGLNPAQCAILQATGCGSSSICNGVCVDIMHDPQHCGSCTATPCAAGVPCVSGVCVAPPPPPRYTGIQFVIATGDDDLRSDSEADATLFHDVVDPDAGTTSTVTQFIPLKRPSDPSWDDDSTHVVPVQLNADFVLGQIDQISIALVTHNHAGETDDNWNIQSVDVSLIGAGGASTPLWSAAGAPLARLMIGSKPTDCSCLTLPQAPAATGAAGTFNMIQFMITTGGDDLRGDSEVTAKLLSGTGATLQNIGLKNQNMPSWDPYSSHVVTAALTQPLAPSALGSVTLTLTSHNTSTESNDNWDVNALGVQLSNNGIGTITLLVQSGSPWARLTGSSPSVTAAVGH